jgi:3-hydroxybutyryl-CoA dehydrogenase
MKEIKTVGIVGFGVMGAAIGLNAAAAGYQVIYKELNDDLVKSMYAKWVEGPLKSRVEKGKLAQDEMNRMVSRIRGTSRYADLATCDLVIEAAVENMDLKIQIFSDLARVCPPETLIASNTSTFLIEKLMQKVPSPERTAGLHYFFPANVNRLVEVIRQKATSESTYRSLMAFAEKNRKIAISVKDFPGFAINPIFISSYMVLDSFIGRTCNVATLEDISQKALGVRFGIMWVQNGSGMGTCYHAAASMNSYLAQTDVGYPMLPAQLKTQFESGKPWDLNDGPVSDDPAARSMVKDGLLGAIFAISSHLIEKQVVSVKDLELGVCTALAWPKGPFTLMNEFGMDESRRLVNLAVEAGWFKLPARFAAQRVTPWQI